MSKLSGSDPEGKFRSGSFVSRSGAGNQKAACHIRYAAESRSKFRAFKEATPEALGGLMALPER
jgi:hypothetical protein